MSAVSRTIGKTSKAKKVNGSATRVRATSTKAIAVRQADDAPGKRAGRLPLPKGLPPKAARALEAAAQALLDAGLPPHTLLQELHEVLLLECLQRADGNYAAAASLFGPSRQSVQQYANSPLRDARWRQYQQNRRRKRAD